MHDDAIERLLDAAPGLWKGRRPDDRQPALPTGHARLDARLPGGGWPIGAVTEIIASGPGCGELSLLLPALAELGARDQWVVMVDPPWIPYPPALRARGLALERLLLVRSGEARAALWACEQVLRSGRGGAVLAWPREIGFPRLRRLQLAAREQGKLAFVFRPGQALRETSPAALRLHLEHGAGHAVRVRVVKCRGAHPPPPLELRLPPWRGGRAAPWAGAVDAGAVARLHAASPRDGAEDAGRRADGHAP